MLKLWAGRAAGRGASPALHPAPQLLLLLQQAALCEVITLGRATHPWQLP